MAVLVRRWPALLLVCVTAFSLAANAYLDRTPDALREQMVKRFGRDAATHLADWQRAMQLAAAVASERQTLTTINALANRAEYLSDLQNWGLVDYWATPAEFVSKNAGDCEDYAIAKYYALRTLGVAGDKLRLIYVRAFFQGQLVPHMVLAWYAGPDAEPLLLDNIDPRLLPASQRPDLSPVFSFNDQGVWRAGVQRPAGEERTASPWNQLQQRVKREMQM
ncbi:transglutaminase-like cysteine peptidase [Uliginosibacterium sp. H3]|uniref:Transglutaminase-like cysteine peptidase n=1 Tax=Uliginosibacterium silvisoli TaxID=3114758 RepID=A0ABU6K6C6_9RHOO|nr:transglutaminase-like cysteine peptidase [Uliginosibacterium sp. H3]